MLTSGSIESNQGIGIWKPPALQVGMLLEPDRQHVGELIVGDWRKTTIAITRDQRRDDCGRRASAGEPRRGAFVRPAPANGDSR